MLSLLLYLLIYILLFCRSTWYCLPCLLVVHGFLVQPVSSFVGPTPLLKAYLFRAFLPPQDVRDLRVPHTDD